MEERFPIALSAEIEIPQQRGLIENILKPPVEIEIPQQMAEEEQIKSVS